MKKIEKKIKMTEKHREAWFNAIRNNDIETVQRMLEDGFNVNTDRHERTALHLACVWRKIDIAKLLIKNGADVNKQNKIDQAPLHIVCYWGYIEIAKLLIDNGATITVKSTDGDTPLDRLRNRYPQECQELTKWLTEHHPDKMLELMASENTPSKGVEI